jgi:hypothetical protein
MPSRTEETIKSRRPTNRNLGSASGKGREVGFEATRRSEARAKSDAKRPAASPRKSGRNRH